MQCLVDNMTDGISIGHQHAHACSHGVPHGRCPQICALLSPPKCNKHHSSSYHFTICIVTQTTVPLSKNSSFSLKKFPPQKKQLLPTTSLSSPSASLHILMKRLMLSLSVIVKVFELSLIFSIIVLLQCECDHLLA